MKIDWSKVNWPKIVKGAAIAGAGAVLTYLSQWASGADFGLATPIVTAFLSVLVNALRKFQQGENG